jgi:hypothetical protein
MSSKTLVTIGQTNRSGLIRYSEDDDYNNAWMGLVGDDGTYAYKIYEGIPRTASLDIVCTLFATAVSPRVSEITNISYNFGYSGICDEGVFLTAWVRFLDTTKEIDIGDGESKNIVFSFNVHPITGEPLSIDDVDTYAIYKLYVSTSGSPPGAILKGHYALKIVTYVPVSIVGVNTLPAEDITNSSAMLKGEIEDYGGECTERGFKYYRDGYPGDVSIVKQEGDFGNGEFSLTAGGLLSGVKYYFKAYAKNSVGETEGSNLSFTTTGVPPTVSTGGVTDIKIDNALGHGVIEETGGEPGVYKCIERGFEVKLDFAGGLGDYAFRHVGGFTGSVGFDMDTGNFEGTLVKYVRRTGSFDAGAFELWLARALQTVFSDMLFAGETYSYRAYAINEDELKGYGDWVGFTTLQVLRETPGEPPDGGHTDGETTEIKNITVQNLEGGAKASRIGIRYGTTSGANEFDVHMDGSFDNGTYKFILIDLIPSTKYYQVPYVLIEDDGGVHEGPLIESETLGEGVGPGAEFPTPHYGPHGQDYREVVTKIFAEKLSTQPIIDFSGGKKSLKIVNHLIQVQSNASVIAEGYLVRFQFAKGKLMVEYATPMPFEREDTIDFDYGRIPFKADEEGVILFRADGEGQINFMNMVSVIVKKIGLRMGVMEKTVEYVATLELEEE